MRPVKIHPKVKRTFHHVHHSTRVLCCAALVEWVADKVFAVVKIVVIQIGSSIR